MIIMTLVMTLANDPESMFEKSFFMCGKKQSISPLPRPNT
jgi:hypothetical protein